MHCALQVFGVITAVCEGLRDGHPLQPRAAAFLKENLDTFFPWIEFFVSKAEYLHTSTGVVMMFVLMDDNLRDHLMGSHHVIKLFLELWTRRDVDRGTYFVTFQQELCCLLDLLNGFLKDDIGRSTFFETLDRDPGTIDIVAKTIHVRIQQLAHHYSSGQCTWKFAIFHLQELLIFTSKLLRTHRTWLAFFRSGDLLRAIPRTLWSITEGKTSQDHWKLVVRVLRQVSELTLDAPLGTYPALLKVIPFVEGGVMFLLAECVNYIPNTSRDHLFAFLMFQHIAAYSIYHEVSPILELMVGALCRTLPTPNGLFNPCEMSSRTNSIFVVSCAVSQALSVHRDRAATQMRVCDAVSVRIDTTPFSLSPFTDVVSSTWVLKSPARQGNVLPVVLSSIAPRSARLATGASSIRRNANIKLVSGGAVICKGGSLL
jgi:hypothetical protein